MQEHTVIGLIGFGNMGQAMAQGLLKSGSVGKGQICACARDQEKLDRNCAALGVRPMRNVSQVIAASDVVILAVKPYQLEDVLAPIREQLKEKLILSVAAGMPFASLESMLAPGCAHLSMIPNTPISTGNGVIVCEQTHSLSEEQLQLINDLFSPCAQLVFVHTDQLSVAGTLSGCGPAFVFLMIEALADAGVKYGLERAKAYALASAMVKGSGALQMESAQHPGALKDAVCSPKGTTIRGICALEESGFRAALIRAIDAIEGR